jgi:hypothetical protein
MIEIGFRVCRLISVCLAILLSACSTSLHGSFVTTSYVGEVGPPAATELGPVEGRSCQTRPLYVFASGDPATTDIAIANARSVHEGTSFIADISIDDETRWGFGYAVQCIVVRATAYR